MIENLHFSLLDAEELDAGAERITTLVTESVPADPLLSSILTLITKDRSALQLALSNAQGSAHTALIAGADAARDDAFVALRSHCESAIRRRTKPAHAAAGELLLRHIRTAGYSLHSFGNSAETGAINVLLTAFASTEVKAAIAQITAGELLTEFKDAQAAFETTFHARIDEKSSVTYPALANARAILGNRLQLLLGLVGALDELDSANTRPELDTLIARLNEAITQILTPARARRTREESISVKPPVPPVS